MSTHLRHLITLGLAATVLVFATALPPGVASAAPAHPLRVVGSGVRAPFSPSDPASVFYFSFNARTPAAPDGVYGTFSGRFPHDSSIRSAGNDFADFSGVVACLQLNGGVATIGGIITSGTGYAPDTNGADGWSQTQIDLASDWFIATATDPKGEKAPVTVSGVDYGSPDYFLVTDLPTTGVSYPTLSSLCNDPVDDLGTTQFPLISGDVHIDS
jgi:hypothetical protein